MSYFLFSSLPKGALIKNQYRSERRLCKLFGKENRSKNYKHRIPTKARHAFRFPAVTSRCLCHLNLASRAYVISAVDWLWVTPGFAITAVGFLAGQSGLAK